MVELSQRDLSLILDIVIAARDAKSFVDGFAEADFLASRLSAFPLKRSRDQRGLRIAVREWPVQELWWCGPR